MKQTIKKTMLIALICAFSALQNNASGVQAVASDVTAHINAMQNYVYSTIKKSFVFGCITGLAAYLIYKRKNRKNMFSLSVIYIPSATSEEVTITISGRLSSNDFETAIFNAPNEESIKACLIKHCPYLSCNMKLTSVTIGNDNYSLEELQKHVQNKNRPMLAQNLLVTFIFNKNCN
jgi:hypothetical protein